MANEKHPTTIKKYANRRLYNTGTSTYVTLEDLARMVKDGEDFHVYDAKTGEDITRPVLGQIIFDQEGKEGQSMLPIAFLRQLIRFYGDSIQMLLPSYLSLSLDKFVSEQQHFRDKVPAETRATPGGQMMSALEDMSRKNMALFNQALTMFNPFTPGAAPEPSRPSSPATPTPHASTPDLDEMKSQIADMQRQIEALSKGGRD